MKITFSALGLALAAALAGPSAFANTGTINFEGKITSSTCPIEVVNPGDGAIGNQVKMGSVDASRFTGIGQEYSGKTFVLRLNDKGNCNLTGTHDVARVTFNGVGDSSGKYFGITPGNDGAKGVAIVIKDHTGTLVPPGAPSAKYPLITNSVNDMVFNAYYRSTATTVTAGTASADVQFVVAVN
ncbi:fimbrial protein [Pseudomonas syringae]|uniref:Fimbrial protein n=1 Tax=Pseudomonas syringae TaxID=317 RepID=A0A9Q4A6J4_PSESX|nr:fimbrial protein [Pseudomonas syringae]MCF5470584.1 fimbrial protein [Pseudomonas syringae]MCF5475544.1 fimbrial protein [Pseudomonas syringae]MCF5485436.1 fimbrial protein [Pseudomonas syringae]MCF5489844.1 fimbrial protein [Pseudomonas syringae]MCF5494158.1 fimbrial protein [Pseudomonas syringae]